LWTWSKTRCVGQVQLVEWRIMLDCALLQESPVTEQRTADCYMLLYGRWHTALGTKQHARLYVVFVRRQEEFAALQDMRV